MTQPMRPATDRRRADCDRGRLYANRCMQTTDFLLLQVIFAQLGENNLQKEEKYYAAAGYNTFAREK
jgi:hypothetical protein